VAGTVLLGVAGATADRDERARAADDRLLAAAAAGRAVTAAHELQEERAGRSPGRPAPAAGRGTGRRPGGGRTRAGWRAGVGGVDPALAAYRGATARLGAAGDPALDRAVAVAAARLARHELAGAGGVAGDRLGLLIVAHLAARNGFRVRLDRSPAGGVTAAVRLLAELLSARTPAPARPH
jgi:hypothetical protein